MGKVAQNSAKYVIKAKLSSNGMVEKPDVVGAIFGQTEGLLGEELDLRELQEKGRVGRIDVNVKEKNGKSLARIKIPSSLDSTETALLAASLETIERVGPTDADIRVEKIEDQRTSKRDYIVKRAKQLLKDIQDDKPEKAQITDEVKEEVRTSEITEYEGFEAGPSAATSEEIILVEGRADILNLLRHGVKNTVALGGTSIPDKIKEIDQDKTLTAFLDGDRGGDLILKELKDKTDVSYVARAPKNKEVEEIGKEETYKALRDKEPVKYVEADSSEQEEISAEKLEELHEILDELVGTRAVYVVDEEIEIFERFPLDNIQQLSDIQDCYAVLFDGKIDNEKIEKAEKAGAEHILGMEKTGTANSSKLNITSRKELARAEN